MKLKQYAQIINKLAEKHPNLKVIYSSDEEGNGYDEVMFPPSICCFTEDREVIFKDDFEAEGVEANAIIVN
jgi:hypothetical protein